MFSSVYRVLVAQVSVKLQGNATDGLNKFIRESSVAEISYRAEVGMFHYQSTQRETNTGPYKSWATSCCSKVTKELVVQVSV